MRKTVTKFVLLVAGMCLSVFFSCVDNRYDLKNDISLDIRVGGDTLPVPLGSTDSVRLSQLIDESAMLVTDETGAYAFTQKGQIDPVNVAIDPVSIDIGQVKIDPLVVDFDTAGLGDFTLEQLSATSGLNGPKIQLDDLKLPLTSSFINIDYPLPAPVSRPGVPLKAVVRVPETEIQFDFAYNLGNQPYIRTLHRLYFGNDNQGQKVTFEIDLSTIADAVDKSRTQQTIRSFRLVFPEGFELEKDPASPLAGSTTVNANVFAVTDGLLDNNSPKVSLSFYVRSLELEASGDFIYSDKIAWEMEYEVDGFSSGRPVSSLSLGLGMETQFQLDQADITTNDIDLEDFPPGSFHIRSSISGLNYIEAVGLVTFKPTSRLDIHVSDPDLPLPLTGGNVIFEFPPMLDVELADNQPPGSSLRNNTLSVPAAQFFGSTISFIIKSVDFTGVPIENGVLLLNERIIFRGEDFRLGSARLLTSQLENLPQKEITITVPPAEMSIEYAEITTDTVVAEVEQTAVFNVNEEVPDELIAIRTVDLKAGAPAEARLSLLFEGIPPGLQRLSFDSLKVVVPPFLKFSAESGVVDGVLTLDGEKDAFNPHKGFHRTLKVTGLDFTSIDQQKGLEMVAVDGKNRLVLSNEIKLKGKVKASETTVSSDDLTGIRISPKLTIDPVQPSKISGRINPQINPINQLLALELDEQLDFLKDSATLEVHNPQIWLTIGNSIGIPVNLKLNMHGKDENGNKIEGSETGDANLLVNAAEVDGKSTESKFIISRQGTATEDYKTIHFEGLSNLLKTVPDTVAFNMEASAAQNQLHHVDLEKPMQLTGEYRVVVPLQFDSLNISYNDTASGLRSTLDGFSERIRQAGMEIIMKVENAIPVELTLEVIPLDVEGKEIAGITATVSGPVPAGKGVHDTADASLSVNLSATGDALPELDALALQLKAVGGSRTVGGVALNKNQFVRLTDLVIVVVGGVDLDLND